MIEETGRVIEVSDGYAWVETQRRSTCNTCSANTGCGTSVLSRVMGQRRTRVRALDALGAHIGDEVIIGVEDATLLRSSIVAYLLPLFGLLAGAIAGTAWGPLLGLTAETGSIFLGLAGIAAGIALLSYHSRHTRHDRRYQPVVLRRINTFIFSN